jgi:hypothetical protein
VIVNFPAMLNSCQPATPRHKVLVEKGKKQIAGQPNQKKSSLNCKRHAKPRQTPPVDREASLLQLNG